jgi:hypothetical protein
MLLPQHSDDAPLRESSAVLPRRTAQEAPSFTPKLPLIRLENGRFRRMTAPDRTEQNVPMLTAHAGTTEAISSLRQRINLGLFYAVLHQ